MEQCSEAPTLTQAGTATISVDDWSGTVLVVAHGDVTAALVDEIRRSIDQRTPRHPSPSRVLVDASGVDGLTADGARGLVDLQRLVLHRGGFFSMLNLRCDVRKQLDNAGLLPFLEMSSSEFERQLRRPRSEDRSLRRWFR
jgi:anti-anti-sigma regulatory factor